MGSSWLRRLTALCFFLAVFLHFIMPVWDVDFPWHLKTGEYIYQHKEIPEADPFSDGSPGGRTEKFLVSNYWLAQVFFYLIFSKANALGIVILRSLLLTGIIALLWVLMKDTPVILKAVVLYFTATLFLAYSGERPQLFSFLFSLVAVWLLEDYRKTLSLMPLFFLPMLMLLWANMHGGFILGDVFIMVVCLSETVKFFLLKKYLRPLPPKQLFFLVGAGFVSVSISYLNPNGYYALTFAIDSMGKGNTVVREYISPLAEMQSALVSDKNFIYWSLIGYCLVPIVINIRRVDITHLALVGSSLLVSLTAMRFVPFFVMIGLFISSSYKFGVGELYRPKWTQRAAMLSGLVLLVLVVGWMVRHGRSLPDLAVLNQMGRSSLHCESASRFIRDNVPGGKMFNSASTGGYLIYGLYPEFKTFVDTRGYDLRKISEAEAIAYAERWDGDVYSLFDALEELLPKDYGKVTVKIGDRPANVPKQEKWLELLDEYKVDIVVHEACSLLSGEMYPLPLRLIGREEWKLVHLDGRVLVFVRDLPRYRDLIARHGLDKRKVYDEIGIESVKAIGGDFHSAPVYSSMAFALLMRGGSDAAVGEYIRHALYLDPKDLSASYLEAFLELKKRGK